MKKRRALSNAESPLRSLVAAALTYAKRGWHVFPLNGKRPYSDTHGHRDATTDPATIRRWWRRWPHANVGIACSSKNGPLVIDIDGKSGARFIESLALPQTREASSRTGHRHRYFGPPANGAVIQRTIRPMGKRYAFDILGDGGYVVAPPSVHPNTGQPYEWIDDSSVLIPFPVKALQLLSKPRARQTAATPLQEKIAEGERNTRLFQFGCSLRHKGASPESILAALRGMNVKQCVPVLDEKEVERIAASCASYPLEGSVVEQSTTLRVVATASGHVKSSVIVYAMTDLDTPLLVDKVDLTSRAKRKELAGQLPAQMRDDALALLTQAAVALASRPIADNDELKKAEDPFPPIEPWPTPVDPAKLLADLCALIRQYVVLPKYGAEAAALWVMHTYAIDGADFTPYLHVTSPVRECGKSTLLDLLAELGHRAQMTGGISAAALYRRIDRLAPSVLLDELDTRLRDEGGDYLKRVLNTGYSRRQGRMTICVGDDHADKDFKTFCPKVLASIGALWDTVSSRSIPLQMQRASKMEMAGLIKIRGDRIGAACLPMRRQLLRFGMDHTGALRAADPSTPERLSARQSDVWRPLFAIADLAGGHWPKIARCAALQLHAREQETDRGLLLLRDLRALFEKTGAPAMTSDEVVNALSRRQDSEWFEYRHGQPITARGVAVLLKRFGVRPKVFRPTAEDRTARGYSLAQLRPIFKKYLPERAPEKEKAVPGRRNIRNKLGDL